MKKKGLMFLVTLILVLMLISGCTPRTTPATTNPRTGNQGLVLRFVPGNPPPHIAVGDPFSIQVEVSNLGAFPQDPSTATDPDTSGPMEGVIYLEGFDPNFFSFSEVINLNVPGVQIPPTLYGKDQYNAKGTTDYVSFNGQINSLPHGDTEFQQRFLVTACYYYRTIALPTVCIDPDPFRTQVKQRICQYNQVLNLGGGQGGPVAVTYVKPDTGSSTIRYDIGISNSGNGLLLKPDNYLAECPNAAYSEVNFVRVRVFVDNIDITGSCRPGDPPNNEGLLVRLIDNKAVITCTFPKPPKEMPAYLAPMKIVISYGYSTSIQGNLRVLPQ